MSEESREWSDEEVVTYLQSVKVAVDEALDNLGVRDDEVSGFSITQFKLSAPAVSPAMLTRLGPRFSPDIGNVAVNGHCGFIC